MHESLFLDSNFLSIILFKVQCHTVLEIIFISSRDTLFSLFFLFKNVLGLLGCRFFFPYKFGINLALFTHNPPAYMLLKVYNNFGSILDLVSL